MSIVSDTLAQHSGQRCAVHRVLKVLPPDEFSAITSAMQSGEHSGSALAAAMNAAANACDDTTEWNIKPRTVQRHLKGECSCQDGVK